MTDWQTIDTAPKDGTHFLAFGGDQEDVQYEDETVTSPLVIWWDPDNGNGDWRFCSYDGGMYGEWKNPTHWQPLPEPPVNG